MKCIEVHSFGSRHLVVIFFHHFHPVGQHAQQCCQQCCQHCCDLRLKTVFRRFNSASGGSLDVQVGCRMGGKWRPTKEWRHIGERWLAAWLACNRIGQTHGFAFSIFSDCMLKFEVIWSHLKSSEIHEMAGLRRCSYLARTLRWLPGHLKKQLPSAPVVLWKLSDLWWVVCCIFRRTFKKSLTVRTADLVCLPCWRWPHQPITAHRRVEVKTRWTTTDLFWQWKLWRSQKCLWLSVTWICNWDVDAKRFQDVCPWCAALNISRVFNFRLRTVLSQLLATSTFHLKVRELQMKRLSEVFEAPYGGFVLPMRRIFQVWWGRQVSDGFWPWKAFGNSQAFKVGNICSQSHHCFRY